MTALAVAVMVTIVVVILALAAPRQRPPCPPGQHVAVTGHATVTIGRPVTVPVYGCRP